MMYFTYAIPPVAILLTLSAAWRVSTMIYTAALRVTPPVPYLAAVSWHLRGKMPDGTSIREVQVWGDDGRLPAWFLPGQGSTYVISLHGKGGDRSDNALGVPRIAAKLGMPAMAISYRGDHDSPPAGLYQYGRTEWRDLHAAVAWALKHGAERIVLVANSYGGGIAASFLRHSDLADKVCGVIFDAPMLSFRACVRHGARSLYGGLTLPLIRMAERFTTWRWAVDWNAMDYLHDVSWLKVPALVFHGDKDIVVPVEGSVRLQALAPPGLVILERARRMGHGGVTGRYLRMVTAFLTVMKGDHGETAQPEIAA